MNNNLCKSEYPFKLIKNNSSFNKKDIIGFFNIFIIIIFISCIFLSKKHNNCKYFAFVSLFIFIYRIYNDPLEMIYMISSILTLGIRTPEFLDKDKYFPNNYLFEENFKILKQEVVDILSKTENGDKLIVDFWGTWCQPCRVMKPAFEKVAEEYRKEN